MEPPSKRAKVVEPGAPETAGPGLEDMPGEIVAHIIGQLPAGSGAHRVLAQTSRRMRRMVIESAGYTHLRSPPNKPLTDDDFVHRVRERFTRAADAVAVTNPDSMGPEYRRVAWILSNEARERVRTGHQDRVRRPWLPLGNDVWKYMLGVMPVTSHLIRLQLPGYVPPPSVLQRLRAVAVAAPSNGHSPNGVVLPKLASCGYMHLSGSVVPRGAPPVVWLRVQHNRTLVRMANNLGSRLRSLELKDTRVTNFPDALPVLQVVIVCGNTGIVDLSGAPQLTGVQIKKAPGVVLPSNCPKLRKLQLDIRHPSRDTTTEVDVREMPKLVDLQLIGIRKVTFPRDMPALVLLMLDCVSEVTLPHTMDSLKDLRLCRTGAEAVPRALPSLMALKIETTPITEIPRTTRLRRFTYMGADAGTGQIPVLFELDEGGVRAPYTIPRSVREITLRGVQVHAIPSRVVVLHMDAAETEIMPERCPNLTDLSLRSYEAGYLPIAAKAERVRLIDLDNAEQLHVGASLRNLYVQSCEALNEIRRIHTLGQQPGRCDLVHIERCPELETICDFREVRRVVLDALPSVWQIPRITRILPETTVVLSRMKAEQFKTHPRACFPKLVLQDIRGRFNLCVGPGTKTIDVQRAFELQSVEGAPSVTSVSFQACVRLRAVRGCENATTATIRECDSLEPFSSLRALKTLNLFDVHPASPQSFAQYPRLESLQLTRLPRLTHVRLPGNNEHLRELHVTGCAKLTEILLNQEARVLNVDRCASVHRISHPLRRMTTLNLVNATALTDLDVTEVRNTPSIQGCPHLDRERVRVVAAE